MCVCVCRMQGLDMATAVRYLSKSDTALQILGAAYIQHQCYHSKDAKNQVTHFLVVVFGYISNICCIYLFMYLIIYIYVHFVIDKIKQRVTQGSTGYSRVQHRQTYRK